MDQRFRIAENGVMDEEVRQWILDGLALPGKSKSGLASAFGRAPSMVTALLKGERELKHSEVAIMAAYFGTEPPSSLNTTSVPLMGRIGAGAEIEPEYEQVPYDGLEHVVIPFAIPDDMIAFEVVGDSMRPAYSPGDVVIVRREGHEPISALHGQNAAVRTADGKRFLKRVARSSEANLDIGLFTLESISNTETTRYGVRLVWASPVLMMVAAREVRRAQKIEGREPARVRRRPRRISAHR